MDEDTKDWAFKLTRTNMQALYVLPTCIFTCGDRCNMAIHYIFINCCISCKHISILSRFFVVEVLPSVTMVMLCLQNAIYFQVQNSLLSVTTAWCGLCRYDVYEESPCLLQL